MVYKNTRVQQRNTSYPATCTSFLGAYGGREASESAYDLSRQTQVHMYASSMEEEKYAGMAFSS